MRIILDDTLATLHPHEIQAGTGEPGLASYRIYLATVMAPESRSLDKSSRRAQSEGEAAREP